MLWNELNYKVLKDQKIHSDICDLGYSIVGNVGKELLAELRNIHQLNHNIETADGGMFYSLYSLDIGYRKRIYHDLNRTLKAFYDNYFKDYKPVIHSFIIKVEGNKSEFTLHQDSTGLDEFKYSPISVWIPLQDTTISNGCLCVVPKSHRIKVPYRGISFNGPFHKISSTIRKYLKPIPMKAGDVLFFDNRLLHYSPENKSSENRIVVMSGIFPKEAKILTCYKDELDANSKIEIYEQKEDFLLTGENFYHDCTIRPKTGVLIDEVSPLNVDLNEKEFIDLAESLEIEQLEIRELQNLNLQMNIISEPLNQQVKPSWKKRLISFLKKV